MTLRYKKSHLHLLLGLGIGLMIAAFVLFYINADEFAGVFLSLSLYNIVLYAFRSTRHYLSIRNGVIIKSGLFGGRIALHDIRRVQRFAGDLVIESATSEIPVYTAFLDGDSLRRFERKLREFELPTQTELSANEPVTG